jgi:hypothetical protein
MGQPFSQDSSGLTPNTNVYTISAVAGKKHVLTLLHIGLSTAATNQVTTITVQDGGTTIWKGSIPSGTAAGTFVTPPLGDGLQGTVNTAMVITVTSPHSSFTTISTLNGAYYDV